MNKVILIDSMWLVNCCAFKLMHLRGLQGRPTGMEYGFLKTLQALNREIPDAKIILCWEGKKNFRKEIDPLYKANRKRNINKFQITSDRIESFKDICKLIYETAEHEEYEADDIIASIACLNKYDLTYLFSNDKDLLQIVSSNPKIVRIPGFKEIYDSQGVNYVETFYNGLKPYQLPIYFAFKGDKVDNVIGIPRINSTKLAGAIKESWNEKFENNIDIMKFINYYQWKNEDIYTITEFIESGKYSKNLSLINLKKDININIQYPPKFEDIKEQLRQWLIKMEFRTLKICKDVGLIHRTTSCDDTETQVLNIIKNNPELKNEEF